MATLEILTYPHPSLRVKCKPVGEITDDIRTLLSNMADTMYSDCGIGLAAPQVGRTERVIVVDLGKSEETGEKEPLYKIVNPEIIEKEGSVKSEEGCLSLPELRECIGRSARVLVQGLDENGKELRIEAEGLLSCCLQHEIDHLDGILVFDHLSRLKRELAKSKLKKLKQK